MHYVAAAVMITIYMYNLPLMIAVMWRDNRYTTALGILNGYYAVSSARRKLTDGRHIKKKKKKHSAGIRTAVRLFRRVDIDSFSARLRVGTGDAASTALLCGQLNALCGVLMCACKKGEFDIRPDFSGPCFRGEISLVVSVKLGSLLGTAARVAIQGG